jgi:hypothetical protein
MSAGTDIRAEQKRKHWRWSAYLSCALLLIILAWPRPKYQAEGSAYAIGAFTGAVVFALGIALVGRFVYVRLIRRDDRAFWSPWIFVAAVAIEAFARAGEVSSTSS